jgi:CheY-like chemotaxis protein
VHPSSLVGIRVLLVDDDAAVRDALHEYFADYGALVVPTSSARSAFDAFMQAPPDVLVSDLRMPGRDGFWLIAAIRAMTPAEGGDVPAIAVTGDVLAVSRAIEAGFQLVHEKPPRLPELVAQVERLAACHKDSHASMCVSTRRC